MFIIPGVLIGLLVVHLWLILKCGIRRRQCREKRSIRRTYHKEYEKLLKEGVPFLGEAMLKDVMFSALVVVAVVLIAAIVGPKGPTGPVDPAVACASPRPEWPFLWLFAHCRSARRAPRRLSSWCSRWRSSCCCCWCPLPRTGASAAPSRRPVAVLSVIVLYTLLAILTYEGATAPWSPKMDAWSGDPVPVRMIQGASPTQLLGAAVFQYKSCRNCHALDSIGGRARP